jgi:hypothetical protein
MRLAFECAAGADGFWAQADSKEHCASIADQARPGQDAKGKRRPILAPLVIGLSARGAAGGSPATEASRLFQHRAR